MAGCTHRGGLKVLVHRSILAGLLVTVAAACSPEEVPEQDGDGPLYVFSGDAVGLDKGIVDVGQAWSAGSIPLCKNTPDISVTLTSIEAVTVEGEVDLEGIGVRTVRWAPSEGGNAADHMIGSYRGIPPGLRAPRGYRVPSTCESPEDPVGEVVVTLRKTGEGGGRLKDLRVKYQADGVPHDFVIHFELGLCGTGDSAPPCRA